MPWAFSLPRHFSGLLFPSASAPSPCLLPFLLLAPPFPLSQQFQCASVFSQLPQLPSPLVLFPLSLIPSLLLGPSLQCGLPKTLSDDRTAEEFRDGSETSLFDHIAMKMFLVYFKGEKPVHSNHFLEQKWKENVAITPTV